MIDAQSRRYQISNLWVKIFWGLHDNKELFYEGRTDVFALKATCSAEFYSRYRDNKQLETDEPMAKNEFVQIHSKTIMRIQKIHDLLIRKNIYLALFADLIDGQQFNSYDQLC